MGARLQYAKVIDRQLFYTRGGRLHPKLKNEVLLQTEPGRAAAFLVMRGWVDDRGACTEQWKLEDPEGQTIYQSVPREIYLPTNSHLERLEDEVAELDLEFAGNGYTAVFYLDDREVARTDFTVRVDSQEPSEG